MLDFNSLKTKALSLVLLGAMILCGSPITANASNTSIDISPDETKGYDIKARFTIDDSTLAQLGYNAYVAVPIVISLTYKSTSNSFTGNAGYFASGIIPDGKKVTVTVNSASSDYGVITDEDENEYTVKGKTGFSIDQSKTSFTKAEMQNNMEASNAGRAMDMITGSFSVAIPGDGFVPKMKGQFQTIVPIRIVMEDA